MLLDLFLNLLEDPPVRRMKSLKEIETAHSANEGIIIKVGRFQEPSTSYAISFVDEEGAHFVIPFVWNSGGEKVSLRKALIQISSRQK